MINETENKIQGKRRALPVVRGMANCNKRECSLDT